jgi:hypothetical protein
MCIAPRAVLPPLLQYTQILPSNKDTGIWQSKGQLVGGLRHADTAVLRSVGDEAESDVLGCVARPGGGSKAITVLNVAARCDEGARAALRDSLALLCFCDGLSGAALYSAAGEYVRDCIADGATVWQQMDAASPPACYLFVHHHRQPARQPAAADTGLLKQPL